MKKNKTVAYMMAAMLLVGGTFAGTKALFTDKETSENTLTLTTGKVDIKVTEGEWYRNLEDKNKDGNITVLDSVGEQIKDPKIERSQEGNFVNVQPGDIFTRPILVDNAGSTYGVDIKIAEKFINDHPTLSKYITINSTNLKEGITELPKGTNSTAYITVKIADDNQAWTDFNGAGQIDLNAIYDITATQKK